MTILKTSTGLIIKGGTPDIKKKCLQFFSLSHPVREYFIYSGNDPNKRPIFGKEHDVIYVTSGFSKINDPVINQTFKHVNTIKPCTPQHIDLNVSKNPRSELQKDCIDKLTTSKSQKITVELKPGTGKTVIALKSISILGLKPLIVVPTTLLKNQWIENLIDEGIDEHDISTNIHEADNKKICVVTITSIENELRNDWNKLLYSLNNSGFGIKIIDEAHLHLKGMLKLDSLCNIRHNWYLSATLGRSDELEDNILNRALLDAERFIGNSKYEEYQTEYVNVYLQDIYYYPSAKLCNDTFKYGTKGLIKPTYYNMLMLYKNGEPFINNIIHMIKVAKSIVKDDSKKMIILVPLIKIIDTCIDHLNKDSYFKKYNIVSIDGGMSINEKKDKLKYGDLIFSTTMSMGTGVDVSDLIAVINFDQYASAIISEQIVGRLRNRGWDCYYFDICDYVTYARSITAWGSKRRAVIPYFPGVNPEMKRLPNIRK